MMVSLLTHICVTRPQWVKVTKNKGQRNTFTFNYSWDIKIEVYSIVFVYSLCALYQHWNCHVWFLTIIRIIRNSTGSDTTASISGCLRWAISELTIPSPHLNSGLLVNTAIENCAAENASSVVVSDKNNTSNVFWHIYQILLWIYLSDHSNSSAGAELIWVFKITSAHS